MSYWPSPTNEPAGRASAWPELSTRPWPDTGDAAFPQVAPNAFAPPPPSPPSSPPPEMSARLVRGYPYAMGLFFVAFFGYLIYLQTRADVGDNGGLRGASDLFVLAGSLTCALACWYTAGRLRGMQASAGAFASRAWIAWVCLGGAAFAYSVGQGIWTWYDANFTSAMLPFPAAYDPFYLLVYPLSWIGVAVLIPRGGTAAGRTRLLLDAGIAVASALAISWYFILGPTVSSLSGSTSAKIVGLAYPLGDLSLCAAAALLLFGPTGARSLSGALSRLAIGVTWLALTDSLYGYLQIQGAYHTGLLQDVGWPMSWLFIGWAALVYPAGLAQLAAQDLSGQSAAGGRSRLGTTGAALRAITPILLALATCAVLIAEVALRNTAPVTQIVIVCAVLIFLPVIRQLLTLIDNLILNERLRLALGQSQQAFQLSQQQLVSTSSRAERYDELRTGIEDLQAVHAQLARGNLNARARLGGPLTPVAQSLNLLVERLNRWVQFAQVNQLLEQEAEQLRLALDELSEGRVAYLPQGHGALATAGALISAARLQRQLNLRFARLREQTELVGRGTGQIMQTLRQTRQLLEAQGGGALGQQAATLQEALGQVEHLLLSNQTLLQQLWRETDAYAPR